jgi:primosomal protein N' (replication factor Y)
MLARILTESTQEAQAEEAAEWMNQRTHALLDEHPEMQKSVLLLMYDVPSVKMLRGKHRRHILMKLLVGREADSFLAAVSDLTQEIRDIPQMAGTEICLEVNPTTMI